MNTTSNIDYSLTKKRLRMMFRTYSRLRSCLKTALLLPVLSLLMLTFCSKKKDYQQSDLLPDKIYYSVPELHADLKRSEELGIPLTVGAQFTSSGEPFTGTKKVYYTENDSLYMEQHYEDGIQTEALMHKKNGDLIRQKLDWSLNKPHLKESYTNGILVYKDVLLAESEDGMGHLRMWYQNGQVKGELSYTGDHMYQGLMTSYDEEGNITEQKRYEDGEVVEEIK